MGQTTISASRFEVVGHARNDGGLLRVFSAEVSKLRLNNLQQLQNHGADTAKMARASAAFEAFADAVDVYVSRIILRIHFRGFRYEHALNAESGQFLGVGLLRAGIFGEIFGGAELLGVDENRRGHGGAVLARSFDQRQVALVQRAHGGDKAEDAIGGVLLVCELFHPGHGSNDFHGRDQVRRSQRWNARDKNE